MRTTTTAPPNSTFAPRALWLDSVGLKTRSLIEATMQDDATAERIASIAPTDPAFVLRIMSYVNSPQFGPGMRVENIQQAAKLLGISGLRSIALTLIVTQLVRSIDGTEMLWVNCLRRAVAARAIAMRVDAPKADICVAAGLMLDAGALVAAHQDAKVALAIYSSPAMHRPIRERVAGLVPHAELSASLAHEFEPDGDFVNAIRRHHDSACPRSSLGQIAWAAERIAGVFEGGCFAPAVASARDALGYVGLRVREFESLLDEIPAAVTELARVLDKPVGPQLGIANLRAQTEANLTAITAQYEALAASLELVVTAKESLEVSLRDSNGRIEKLTSTDALTGVLTRSAIESALSSELARADRGSSHLSVILVDIDHFATINECWGHPLGDSVLTMVGRILVESLRLGDAVGRIGGDEFLCILPDIDSDEAAVVAERVRQALLQNAVVGPRGLVSITASIGLSTIRGPGCRTAREALLTHAAQCKAQAQQLGRDCVVYNRSA